MNGRTLKETRGQMSENSVSRAQVSAAAPQAMFAGRVPGARVLPDFQRRYKLTPIRKIAAVLSYPNRQDFWTHRLCDYVRSLVEPVAFLQTWQQRPNNLQQTH